MDIFHIEAASLGTNHSNGSTVIDDQIPQVSFDGGPEFNLNFFDSPDNSNTGYSDPGSDSSSSPPSQLLNIQANAQAIVEFCGTTSKQLTATAPTLTQSNGMRFFFFYKIELTLIDLR